MNEHNGLTLTQLCEGMGMTRQSVTKHLAVLEAAGLVTTLRQGREKLHYLNAAPINDIADRWIHTYDRTRAKALSDLKTALEATTPMDTTEHSGEGTTFVYSTYIQATPERVWQGLTDPAFTTRYWRHPTSGGVTMASDWKKGSTYDLTYGEHDTVISHPDQVVLESTPTAGCPTPGTPTHPSGPSSTASTRSRLPSGRPSRAPRWPSTSRSSGPVWSS